MADAIGIGDQISRLLWCYLKKRNGVVDDVDYDMVEHHDNTCALLQQQIEKLHHTIKMVEGERDVLDANHKAMAHQLARTGMELTNLRLAVNAFLGDVRRLRVEDEEFIKHLDQLDVLVRGVPA